MLSIIIPTFNSADTVEICINSILSQTYTDYEIIIVDAVSKDNTLQIVQHLVGKNEKIQIVSEPDRGIYDAMNKGINISKGEWLLFLGSDDYLERATVLQEIFSDDQSNFDLIYGNVKVLPGEKIYDGKFNLMKLLLRNICHQSIFYKKTLFNKHGLYNFKYKVNADWVFNMKVLNDRSVRIKFIDKVISVFSETGLSSNTSDAEFESDRYLFLQYFPFHIQFFYKHRDVKFIGTIFKWLYLYG